MPKRVTPGSVAQRPDSSELARVVPSLAPETLHQLIRARGLDACGDVVAAATTSQLQAVFDLDLWRAARPGEESHFDADRFGEWLELLADAADAGAANTLAAMDPKLAIAGLSRYVRVFDVATLPPSRSGDDEALDDDPSRLSPAECQVGGYLVRAIRMDAWDAIVTLLLLLEADHPEAFHAILRGCRGLSNSTPEPDGLDDLLSVPEQLLHDVAGDRDSRRSQQGYSTTADARAFLQLARQPRPAGEPRASHPIAAAYLRAAAEASPNLAETTAADRPAVDAVVRLLSEAGLIAPLPRALLSGTEPHAERLTVIRTLMAHLHEADVVVFAARSGELAFLANTLVAGCSIQSRSFTPNEASEVVVGVCNLGLEHWPAHWPEFAAAARTTPARPVPEDFLIHHDLVRAFEVGWTILHQDVCLFAAKQLIAALKGLRCGDTDTQRGVAVLRRELTIHWKAGTPWRARPALEVIALLDMPAWIGLLGLIAECPVLPAAVKATLEGQLQAVSVTEFDSISTRRQIDTVRAFMARLPELLAG